MRTTIVSTSKLKISKILGIVITISLLIVIIATSISQIISGRIIEGSTMPLIWIYLAFKSISMISNLKSISYDDSSVYYQKDDFEVQIPFEDIKDIEIKTLTGIYVINLYRPAQDGDKIWFKTSMKYPLNFKKKDAEVNILRDKIDRYKRSLPEKNYRQLSSYNI
jgi:hypothetical protein